MKFNSDHELYSAIGRNIKLYRLKAGYTQIQLAEEAKVSVSYITKIEAPNCDKSISLSMLNQIANALEVEINKFFEYKE